MNAKARAGTRILSALAALGLAGCMLEPGPAEFRRSETQLEAAREQAAVHCVDADTCALVWNRARLYVELHSPTAIRRMNAHSIETGMPHRYGVAWFWAERSTTPDGVTTIRLKGMCRGMYDTDGEAGWIYTACAAQIRRAERAFRDAVRDPG